MNATIKRIKEIITEVMNTILNAVLLGNGFLIA